MVNPDGARPEESTSDEAHIETKAAARQVQSSRLKLSWTKLALPEDDSHADSLVRYNHSISVFAGRAYIFGGLTPSGELCSNAMHIVKLPTSPNTRIIEHECIPATPFTKRGRIPQRRHSHVAVVQGLDILIIGGNDLHGPLHNDSVWQFSTVDRSWRCVNSSAGRLTQCDRINELRPLADANLSQIRMVMARSDQTYAVTQTTLWYGCFSTGYVSSWQCLLLPAALAGRKGGVLQVVSRSGRKYLLYAFGSPKEDVEDEDTMGARSCLDDAWTLQLRPRSTAIASVRNALRKVVGAQPHDEPWKKVRVADPKGEAPVGLAGMASAMMDRRRILVSGGKTGEGAVCGDIWILMTS